MTNPTLMWKVKQFLGFDYFFEIKVQCFTTWDDTNIPSLICVCHRLLSLFLPKKIATATLKWKRSSHNSMSYRSFSSRKLWSQCSNRLNTKSLN